MSLVNVSYTCMMMTTLVKSVLTVRAEEAYYFRLLVFKRRGGIPTTS